MAELVLLARWTLAAVLLVSALAKLADRERAADAAVGLGVPERLRWAAPAVPVAELALALLLVVPATSRGGAVGAVVLLAAFTVVIAANLARGRRPACNCFGRLDPGPIGGRTLVRNGVLIGVAVVAASGEAAAAGDLVGGISLPVAAAFVAVAVAVGAIGGLTWLVTELWRQQARLLVRIDALEAGRPVPAAGQARAHRPAGPVAGPPVGGPAPDPSCHDVDGSPVALSSRWTDGRDTLVVFGDPDCPACRDLHPDLAAWQAGAPDRRQVVVISRTDRTPVPAGAALLVEQDRAATAAYGVRGTPSAVLVDGDGNVAAPLAEGFEAVRSLMDEVGRAGGGPVRVAPRPARAGQVVPDLDLDGVDDRDLLLVFWNEGCVHCRGMVSGLQARSRRPDAGVPRIAFVVPSAEQADAATSLLPSATAVVDVEMRVNLALGVPGTPSAALVGPDRRLLADLAVGPDAVFELLDGGGRSV